MEEQFIMELIEDLDHMRQMLERCVRKLRSRVSGNSDIKSGGTMPAVRVSDENNGIRSEIDRQRQIIMAQVEQAKAQAMAAATTARSTGMSGMPGIPSMGSMIPETLKELQQKIAAERNTDKSEGVEKSDSAGPVLKT
jgi:hypothetical protein